MAYEVATRWSSIITRLSPLPISPFGGRFDEPVNTFAVGRLKSVTTNLSCWWMPPPAPFGLERLRRVGGQVAEVYESDRTVRLADLEPAFLVGDARS